MRDPAPAELQRVTQLICSGDDGIDVLLSVKLLISYSTLELQPPEALCLKHLIEQADTHANARVVPSPPFDQARGYAFGGGRAFRSFSIRRIRGARIIRLHSQHLATRVVCHARYPTEPFSLPDETVRMTTLLLEGATQSAFSGLPRPRYGSAAHPTRPQAWPAALAKTFFPRRPSK